DPLLPEARRRRPERGREVEDDRVRRPRSDRPREAPEDGRRADRGREARGPDPLVPRNAEGEGKGLVVVARRRPADADLLDDDGGPLERLLEARRRADREGDALPEPGARPAHELESSGAPAPEVERDRGGSGRGEVPGEGGSEGRGATEERDLLHALPPP